MTTILAIDDAIDSIDFLELFLRGDGYHVRTPATGADGLSIITISSGG